MANPQTRRVHCDAGRGRLHPVAQRTLLAALDQGWADPKALFTEGVRASHLLAGARGVLAEGLGARSEDVSLHDSPESSLDVAIRGVLRARRRPVTVTTTVDQAVVLERSSPVRAVEVDALGRVDVDAFAEALAAHDVGVAVVACANGEVGTRQPVAALREAAAAAGVPLILDATAAWGRDPWCPTLASGAAEVLVASAGPCGGPPLGLLAVSPGTPFYPDGHAAELGRAFTSPWPPLALAAAEAWQQSRPRAGGDADYCHDLTCRIRAAAAHAPQVEVVGDPEDRMPHVVTFSALYADGEAIVRAFDRHGYAVASGSACTSRTLEPSHVLAAMGALTHGNVRITLPPPSVTPYIDEDIDRFCDLIPEVVRQVRDELGAASL